ncbi:MAG: NADH-quinone oxidoreductase subunit NuoH [Deltaproteobacteria bacterium]|jgi:NADH-quinone oxidoreductase subunit H|nr:NADH-quinone oxidoreductase subunit NuoH [Deltaproteobacteria bacterium]
MVEFLSILIIKTLVVFAVSMLIVAYSTWIERKVLGHVQLRHGPTRVGFHGLLQPIADGIKGFFKEEVVPDNADKPVFILAPIISIAAALSLLVIIPFGDSVTIMGHKITLYLTDLDIGILYVLGISTIGSYGVMLGGWSSGNKYGVLGGLRASAQMISYELSMALAVISVVMVSGTLSLVGIVEQQAGLWNIVKQPLAFFIFIVCGLAELNRTPFDMPEAEAELACGYNVEYSSMKFALFFMAEYAHMFVFSAMVTTLFLGGWHGPLLPGPVWFFIKTFALIFFCVWERSTFPRYRYDEVMELGWKVLLPAGLLNILLTGLWMVIFNI